MDQETLTIKLWYHEAELVRKWANLFGIEPEELLNYCLNLIETRYQHWIAESKRAFAEEPLDPRTGP